MNSTRVFGFRVISLLDMHVYRFIWFGAIVRETSYKCAIYFHWGCSSWIVQCIIGIDLVTLRRC